MFLLFFPDPESRPTEASLLLSVRAADCLFSVRRLSNESTASGLGASPCVASMVMVVRGSGLGCVNQPASGLGASPNPKSS